MNKITAYNKAKHQPESRCMTIGYLHYSGEYHQLYWDWLFYKYVVIANPHLNLNLPHLSVISVYHY